MASPVPPNANKLRTSGHHDFDNLYATSTPAWDIGRPQPAFERLARHDGLDGKVLDVGCGTGEHALLAASLGHDAVGVDLSARAIELAKVKAADRRLNVRFLVLDALRLPDLGEQFDTVLDCGLFHVLDETEPYVRSLSDVLPQGGRFHLLCFSDHQPGDWGPRRVTETEIRDNFGAGWTVDSIVPAVIETTFAQARAWQAAFTRV